MNHQSAKEVDPTVEATVGCEYWKQFMLIIKLMRDK
jgi:hypothetical protein